MNTNTFNRNRFSKALRASKLYKIRKWRGMPPKTLYQLDEIVDVVKNQPPHEDNLILIALFTGPSGTGKTYAAKVLENAFAQFLFRVDLAMVVSKYIGETEKNLDKIFDAAGSREMILLFDNADALFGKRLSFLNYHFRRANRTVNYFFKKLTKLNGIVIMSMSEMALDNSSLHYIDFCVDFS